jgi:hypothetical protein
MSGGWTPRRKKARRRRSGEGGTLTDLRVTQQCSKLLTRQKLFPPAVTVTVNVTEELYKMTSNAVYCFLHAAAALGFGFVWRMRQDGVRPSYAWCNAMALHGFAMQPYGSMLLCERDGRLSWA